MGSGITDRDLFRRAAVFAWRLCFHTNWLYRRRDPQLHAWADFAVCRLQIFQYQYWRAVLARIRECAMELGESLGPGQTSTAPDRGAGPGRYGAADSDYARKPAGRAA